VPYGCREKLDLRHRAHGLLEGWQSAASLQQRQGVFAMPRLLENEMRQSPPMKIVKVELAAHGEDTTVGDDGAQRDYTPIVEVLGQRGVRGDLINPPDPMRWWGASKVMAGCQGRGANFQATMPANTTK